MQSKPTYQNIHLRFKLNGTYFNREDLTEVAYSFVKEGEPFEQAIGDFLMYWLDEKDTILVQTSGSTGHPKMIPLSKQAMVDSALASGDFFGLSVGDSALHCLPADFIAGKMMLVRAMILGLEIDLVKPTTHPLKGIDSFYDFAAMTPMQVEGSIKKINQIKKLIIGGAPVGNDLIKKLQKKKTQAFETYGMTETVTHVAARKLNHLGSGVTKAPFRSLPGVFFSTDERGCLVIKAAHLDPEPLVTNDLVELKGETDFEWLGRVDHVINSGGVKIIPEILERKLAKVIPGDFFLYGYPDDQLGQRLTVLVEGKGDANVLLGAIQNISGFKKYHVPKEIHFVDVFERTENGKTIRETTAKKAFGL